MVGGAWIGGTGRVMFRPARAEDNDGFAGIEELWKRTVMFGLSPDIRKALAWNMYLRDSRRGIFRRVLSLGVMKEHK